MLSDAYENPKTYHGWIYPVRYILSLRYLKLKQLILATFRDQKIYPIADSEFKSVLIEKLSPKQKKTNNPILSWGFKSVLIYPLFIAAFAFGAYTLNHWYQQKRVENILANYLPYYSDLLHRKLLITHNNGSDELLKAINDNIESTEKKILNDLPEKDGVRDIVQKQLLKLKDPSTDNAEIMMGFKAVNTLFDQYNQPYYLSPKSFTMPCSSLIDAPVQEMMMLKELESLMSNNDPELCRTTMMTSYKVDDRTQLFYDEQHTFGHASTKDKEELPLFHVRRIDKVPAVDGALGLTFKNRGIGSIILVDRIKNFARESVLPALSFQGRSYIIPYWMQGYYEIEEAVTKGYKKDLNEIYPDKKEQRKVKALIKRYISDQFRMQNSKLQQTMQRTNSNNDKNIFGNGFDAISVFLGKKQTESKTKKVSKKNTPEEEFSLRKLDKTLYPSIEYHEAYHQIDKSLWKPAPWLKGTFKDKLDANQLEHTLEELGAYLAQLANTNQGQNIWLSKLLIFSLNPMTQGQAEYYASSIIFNTIESIDLGKPVNPNYIATVEDKTRIFKSLLKKDSTEISRLAKTAYEILFQRPVPVLTR